MNDFTIGNPNIKVNSSSLATGPEFMTNTTTIDPKAGVSPQYKNAVQGKFANAVASKLGIGSIGPLPNDLRDFASYNYIWTLGCLNNYEINFPDKTYRKRDPSIVILRSGGNAGNGGATAYESKGKVEYYIDNVDINCLITPSEKYKQSNAFQIDFEIMEPYSMGLFLQALQVAALRCGHKNYLEAPYVLSVDFKGWNDNGINVSKPNLRRIFPLSLVNIDFEVNEGGSMYKVKAIPWHEQALADQAQSVKTDVTIVGKNVQELLQSGGKSLAEVLNNREQEKKKAKEVITPNEYVIIFPKGRTSADENLLGETEDDVGATADPNKEAGGERELSEEKKRELYESITGENNAQVPEDFDAELSKLLGTVVKRSAIGESIRDFAEKKENLNDIGKSNLVSSYLDGGQQPFGRPKFVESEKTKGTFERGKVQISDNGRALTFKSGTTIQEIIEEVVILSDYGRKVAEAEPDQFGMIPWFKIQPSVYLITDEKQMNLSGKYPMVFVYRVVPFKAHVSRYAPVTKASPGIEMLKSQAVKEYDYIYSGKNDDVLKFDLNFNLAFFTSISPFGGKTQSGVKDVEQNKTAGKDENPKTKPIEGDSSNISQSGSPTLQEKPKQGTGGTGGTNGLNSTPTSIARDFNDALVNSDVDLITASMTIMGDPYYIADSGMGNYSAGTTPIINITEDGTMDYQSSEVDVLVNFRTPLDISQTGGYDFPRLGISPTGAFSGLYQVYMVRNSFSEGVFSQDLKMIRRKNQTGVDTKSEPTSEKNLARDVEVQDKKNVRTDQGAGTSGPGLPGGDPLIYSNDAESSVTGPGLPAGDPEIYS